KVRKAYPGIEINIHVETSNVLARELLAALHDFIIGRIPDDLNPRLFEVTEIGIELACLIVRTLLIAGTTRLMAGAVTAPMK
ncbi:hypothetical protein ACC685_38185, partial [Rhizobium ruizarguesonis]